MKSNSTWDVIVVGGGVAGLSAALTLVRARRRVLVLDAGQPRNRFTRHMHAVLGRDGTAPSDLLEDGRREVRQQPNLPVLRLDSRAPISELLAAVLDWDPFRSRR